jgi:hypothetical protein
MSETLGLQASREEPTLVVVATQVLSLPADETAAVDDEPRLLLPPPIVPSAPVLAGPVRVRRRRRAKEEELTGHWKDATRAQLSQVGIVFYR